ncbi:MAG TPA: hypothetical protein VGI23_27030 [Steroidobacteraceae bacterium]
MSLHNAKRFSGPLALASAAFLIHIGAAIAADFTGNNIQEQMNALLAGTAPAHFAPQSGPRNGTATTPTANAQESVRQVLLGTIASTRGSTDSTARSELARTSSETKSRERVVAYGDSQPAVRQVLLGQRNASDAS